MLDIYIVIAYLVAMIILGITSGLSVKNFTDYAVGRKNFSNLVIMTTMFATLVGGGTVMGLTERAYSVGMIAFFTICLGSFFGDLFVALVIVPRFEQFQDCLSVGDMIEKFYGRSGKICVGVAGVLSSAIKLGLQASALGFVCNYFFGYEHWVGALFGLGAVIVYSSFGGIRSVTITDVIQFGILTIAIPILCQICFVKFNGVFALLQSTPSEKLNLIPDSGEVIRHYSLFFVYMTPMLAPEMIQRFLITKNAKQAQQSYIFYSFISLPLYFAIILLGLAAYQFAPDINADHAFPFLVNTFLHVGVKGVVVIALLAAIMSSADSLLHLSGLMFTHDIIRPLFKSRLHEKNELILARVFTILLGAISLLSALNVQNLIELNILSYVAWAPLVSVPLLAGIFGYKSSVKTFFACGLVGISTCLFWKFFIFKFVAIDSLVPAMIASFFTFVVSSETKKINSQTV